ncbi:MAG: hypothetical protein IJ165_04530 [Proteobacteria bacterium]|nr:hypothetical protein [Pseudomonadota bacterium]
MTLKNIATFLLKAFTLTGVGTLVSAGACEYGPDDNGREFERLEYERIVAECCKDAFDAFACKTAYDLQGYCETSCCEASSDADECKRKLENEGICENNS